jgi:hypothetical protein
MGGAARADGRRCLLTGGAARLLLLSLAGTGHPHDREGFTAYLM